MFCHHARHADTRDGVEEREAQARPPDAHERHDARHGVAAVVPGVGHQHGAVDPVAHRAGRAEQLKPKEENSV